jgi:hypothetical protein
MNKMILLLFVLIILISGCTNDSTNDNGIHERRESDTANQPYCGNSICEQGELASCCKDCGCDVGYHCTDYGCRSKCGDGIQASDETSANCCNDVGCPVAETCENNICVKVAPIIKARFHQGYEGQVNLESVTMLRSMGSGNPIGYVILLNSGNDDARNVKMVISSPDNYFDTNTVNINSIYKGGQKTQHIYLNFNDNVLEISDATSIPVSILVEYYDSFNIKHQEFVSSSMQVLGRNSLSRGYGKPYSAYVTPLHPLIREFASKSTSGLSAALNNEQQTLAARWLFESMRSYGIDYVNDVVNIGDYVQFPYETMKNKNGDCEDLAILYASLLESVGIEAVIIRYPEHVLAGYINKMGYLVPVETTLVNSGFDAAISTGLSEYNQHKSEISTYRPRSYRSDYQQVLYAKDKTLPLPDITKQVGSCSIGFNLQDMFVATVHITFTNTGTVTGAGCAAVVTYHEGIKRGEDYSCWTLLPGENKQVVYESDINVFQGADCVVY